MDDAALDFDPDALRDKYRAERETRADELIERRAQGFLKEPATSSYLVAAERRHHSRRGGRRLDAAPIGEGVAPGKATTRPRQR